MEEKIMSYKGVVNYVDIEITESAMVDEQNSIIEIMKKLKGLGFKMSMDDFGTGYSSLSNISLLPFDTLKIDKSFVDKVDPNNVDSPSVYLISDVISIAKHFNMHSLVEGVETKEQRDLLKDLGCEYCQGYYYAKPMPIEEFEELLAKDEVFRDN
jgi:EAL domain-containing protein (putative c-di-GMP-specific phosphodiesterase class I)